MDCFIQIGNDPTTDVTYSVADVPAIGSGFHIEGHTTTYEVYDVRHTARAQGDVRPPHVLVRLRPRQAPDAEAPPAA